jgi:hypothetical protein
VSPIWTPLENDGVLLPGLAGTIRLEESLKIVNWPTAAFDKFLCPEIETFTRILLKLERGVIDAVNPVTSVKVLFEMVKVSVLVIETT